MDDVLPGYQYEPDTARYRSLKNGRFVSRIDINNLLREQVQDAEGRFHDLAIAYYEGDISAATFVEQMHIEQQRHTLQNIALAVGGFALLSYALLNMADASLREQYIKIIGTAQDVVDSKVSLPQLLNRVSGYVGEGRRIYYEALRQNAPSPPAGMTTIYRRILGDAQHCQDCLDLYDAGWSTELVPPGSDSVCQTHCRCSIISRDVPTAELDQWLGTKN